MLIGELAQETGLSRHAIRFYEREGLLAPSERLDNGYRSFAPGTVQRLAFITRLKELGFTLSEIDTLLRLREGDNLTCSEAGATIKKRTDEIESEIARLRTLRADLDAFFQPCSTPDPAGKCTPLAELHAE